VTRPLAILGVVIAFVSVFGLIVGDNGMAACQLHHSFDVCAHALK